MPIARRKQGYATCESCSAPWEDPVLLVKRVDDWDPPSNPLASAPVTTPGRPAFEVMILC